MFNLTLYLTNGLSVIRLSVERKHNKNELRGGVGIGRQCGFLEYRIPLAETLMTITLEIAGKPLEPRTPQHDWKR